MLSATRRADRDLPVLDGLGGVDDEVRPGGGLDDHSTVRQDVPDAPDDERRVAKAVELGLETLDLALQTEDLGLHVMALALDALDRLGELGVAELEEVDPVEGVVLGRGRFGFAHGCRY